MGDSTSLVSFGDWAKPVDTLIVKISDALGGLYRPYQIRRVAQAEADADKIRAVAQIEIDEMQKRAIQRFVLEETKKQENIESIMGKAFPEVSAEAKPENIEDDWIANFFDKCRLISDEDMQALWARILAGEANSPGKFSKRTIGLLASLDKTDAETLRTLCSFGFLIGVYFETLVYSAKDQIYADRGVDFDSLSHLETIGLIQFDVVSGYTMSLQTRAGFTSYFGQKLWLEFPQGQESTLHLGCVLLTQSGRQLASICAAVPVDGFADYVKEKWKSFGYKTEP